MDSLPWGMYLKIIFIYLHVSFYIFPIDNRKLCLVYLVQVNINLVLRWLCSIDDERISKNEKVRNCIIGRNTALYPHRL